MPSGSKFAPILTHRSDLDGLRGIAILLVMLFHAGVPGFVGGFRGVDLFFVLSGFLITSVTLAELQAGTFRFSHFYLRRAKRLLPNLFLVLLFTLIVGALVLSPAEYSRLARHALATIFFSSNHSHLLETGYFDSGAHFKPLLMTWSLSVEEQFYFVWPLILAWVAHRRWLRLGVPLVLAVVSFAVYLALPLFNHTQAAFFLFPPRMFQPLSGGILALVVRQGFRQSKWLSLATLLGGLALIVLSTLSGSTGAFPGFKKHITGVLWPVLSAALLILPAYPSLWRRWLLENAFLVKVGKLSYSLYLWHWPLLAFAHILARNAGFHLSLWQIILVQGVAALLAVLAHDSVEYPLRRRAVSGLRVAVRNYAAAAGVLVVVSVFILVSSGLPARWSGDVVRRFAAAEDHSAYREQCLIDTGVRLGTNYKYPQACGDISNKPTLTVWGDSHADAISPGFRELAARYSLQPVQRTRSKCPPVIGSFLSPDFYRHPHDATVCKKENQRTYQKLTAAPPGSVVVLAARWARYLHADCPQGCFGEPEESHLSNAAEVERQALTSFSVALRQTVEGLTAAGQKVILVGQAPELRFPLPYCQGLAQAFVLAPLVGLTPREENCRIDLPSVEKRIGESNQLIRSLAGENVFAMVLSDKLCDGQSCRSQEGSTLYYYDDDHLSAAGARVLVERFGIGPFLRSHPPGRLAYFGAGKALILKR